MKIHFQQVLLAMGIFGCLRKKELVDLTVDNVKEEGSLYHITIPDTKPGRSKSFVTAEDVKPIIEKYMKLRPTNMDSKRFFLQYNNSHCTRQVIFICIFIFIIFKLVNAIKCKKLIVKGYGKEYYWCSTKRYCHFFES